jgi:hypothetical protein
MKFSMICVPHSIIHLLQNAGPQIYTSVSWKAVPWLRWLASDFPLRQLGFDPRSCGICGGQNGTEAGFLQELLFALPIIIPPAAPYSLIILSPTLYSLDTEGVVKQQILKVTNSIYWL